MNPLISSKEQTIFKDLPIFYSLEGFCTAVKSMICMTLPGISISLRIVFVQRVSHHYEFCDVL